MGQSRSGEQSFVNIANGNLVLQDRDDVLIARGLDVTAVRTYNSQGLFADDNGDNWSVGAFGQKVVLTVGTAGMAGSSLTRTDRDGAQAVYTWDVTRSGYVSPAGAGAFDTIIYDSGAAQFIWTDGDTGRVERYQSNGSGRLISVTDAYGNTVSYAYNANGTVQSVTDANGDVSYYDYGGGTNLNQIRSLSGGVTTTSVRYTYDASNRLTKVTVDLSPEDNAIADGKVYSTIYTYDGTSKRVASLTQSDGTSLSFTYVQDGGSFKVSTVTDALGQTTRFAYDAVLGSAVVTDPLGAQSSYRYDAQGQLVQVRQGVTASNPTGLSQVSYRYDTLGNVTGITDGEGHEVAYTYDASGNLLREVDSAGNVRTRTYNAANQLLSETVYGDAAVSRGAFSRDAALAEVTRYVYAQGNERQLRFVVSPQGDVAEQRYDSYGQSITTVRYASGTYNVASLDPAVVPTEAQMTSWAGTQDLRRTERIDRAYDARGALASSTTYGDIDVAGVGLTTTAAKTQYVYDQRGLLLKTIEPTGGGTTTYIYDGLGRVLTVAAPSLDGVTPNTTVTSYDDAGGKTSVTIATGLVTVSAYDKAGRLVSVTQQSTGTGVLGTTAYAYDKDGNLLMTQDPTAVRKWMLYDEANRKIAEIDATGALVEYVYNSSGQLRQTVAYATRLASSKLAQLVDGGGLPTTAWSATNTTTSLAALRPAGVAQDQKVWRFYDNAGRLAWQVDGLGYVTQTTYDGASRILAVTQLANPIDVAPLILGASVDLGVDPSTLGGIALSLNIAEAESVGGSTLLTAIVEGASPGGMATFFDGETIVGSALVIDGKAVLLIERPSVGTHTLRVAYSGDALRPATVSKAIRKTITQAPTSAVVGFVPSSPTYGQPVTISAGLTVAMRSLGIATGEVKFYSGTTLLGIANVVNGQALLTVNNLPGGTHGIRAEYAGDALHAAFVQTATLTVAGNPTKTTLQVAPASGGAVQLTAAILVNAIGLPPPSGTVNFYKGGALVGTAAVLNGAATLQVAESSTFEWFQAIYSGDSNNVTSNVSGASPSPAVISLVASAASTRQGNPVTLTANVSGGALPGAVGRVSFFAGTTLLGTATVINGQATLTTGFLPVGANLTLSAAYGEQLNAGSAQGPTLQVTAFASSLGLGEALTVGQSIFSPSGRYQLILQSDGNLVVYDRKESLQAVWNAQTQGQGVNRASFQADGNFVLLKNTNVVAWNSATAGQGAKRLQLEDDGSLAIYTASGASLWRSGSDTVAGTPTPGWVDGVAPPGVKAGVVTGTVVSAIAGLPVVLRLGAGPWRISPSYGGYYSIFDGQTLIETVRGEGAPQDYVLRQLSPGVHNLTLVYSGDSLDSMSYHENYAPGSGTLTVDVRKVTSAFNLSSSAPQVVQGQPITLTAKIYEETGVGGAFYNGPAASGPMTFYMDGVAVGTANAVNGVATLTLRDLPLGKGVFSAVYAGDTNHLGASSAPLLANTVTQVVVASTQTVASILSLTTSQAIAPYGSPVTFTATLKAASDQSLADSGTVLFYLGSELLGTGEVINGQAKLTVSLKPVDWQHIAYSVTARFSGNAGYGPAEPVSVSQQVIRHSSTTTLTASRSSVTQGQQVTLTAQVSGISASGLATFFAGSTYLGVAHVSNGVASLTTSYLPAGAAVQLRVTYSGDADNEGSIAAAVPMQVAAGSGSAPAVQTNAISTTIAVVPGIGYSTLINFSGISAPLDYTGSFTIFEGQTLIGSGVQQNGEGITLPPLPLGIHNLTVVYSGNAGAGPSSGTFTLDIPQLESWVTLRASAAQAVPGAPVTLTATVIDDIGRGDNFRGPSATGIITFTSYNSTTKSTTTLGTGTLVNGVATLTVTNLLQGENTFSARYLGDENYEGISASGAKTTGVASPVPTSTSFNAAPTQSTIGSPILLTAKPAGQGSPQSGTVSFYDGTTLLATVSLVDGAAILSVNTLDVGPHTIKAVYSGDVNNATSTANTIVTVLSGLAPASLTNLTTPSVAKDGILSVRVIGRAPSGLVSFYSGTTLLGVAAVLADGTATLRGIPIPQGTHTFSAAYSGDEANADGAITFTQVVEGTPDTPRLLVGLDITQDRTVTQLYNRNGQLQGTLDGEGYLTEYKYNAAGEQVQSIRYANRAANFASVSARLMAVAIARASGDLSGVRPAASDGDVRTYTFYNARGQLVGQVDGEGFLTETTYDTRGNVVQTKRYYNPAKTAASATATVTTIRPDPHAQDQTVTQTWSAANQLLSRTNAEGTVTSFTYDVAGRLVQTTTAAGTPDERIQRQRYDIQGNLIAELDGRGSAAVALTDPLATWAANGATHAYDSAGRHTSTTDANGHRTLFFYDAYGRLTYTVNAMGEVSEKRYDALGQLSDLIAYGTRIDVSTLGASTPGGLNTNTLVTQLATYADPAKDRRTVLRYNATGTLASRSDAISATTSNLTSYSYNAFREVTASSQTRLSGQVVTNTVAFDRRGLQVSSTLDASGAAIGRRTGYDAFGRPDTRIDGNGNTSSLRYDRLGRVVTTTDASGAARTTTYDAFSRVLTQRDALNNVTSYAYSVANRSVTVTTPEGVSVTTVHNRQGQTLSVLDGRGNTTTYSYDKSGNLLKTQAPEGVATSTTYDKIGLALTSTDARGTVTAYVYDAADRLLTRTVDTTGLKLVTTYQYDATGSKISVTDPGGTFTTYKFDLSGQVLLETVDPTGLNLQTAYTYDTDGTTLSVLGSDGRLTRFSYDGAGRRIKEQVDPLGLNLTRSYEYDGQGNVVKAIDGTGNATLYIYDKANRKVFTVDAMGGVQQTTYDAEGRVSAETTYAAFVPVAAWNGVAPTSLAMQALLPTLGAAAVQRQRYDRDGRLRFSIDATGAVVEYRYDMGNNVVESRAYAKRIDLALWSGTIDPPVQADDLHDVRSRSVYDNLGRRTYTIDGTGAVVQQVFDANGNVTQRIAYSKPVPVATAATVAALTPAVAAVANAARDQRDVYVYDRANRPTSHTDGMGMVTTQTFDNNGNVTSRASWSAQQAGTNLLTQSEFANGLSDAPTRLGAVSVSSMAGFAGALRLASDPGSTYAYKSQTTTAGATYTLSVIVEMEDGLPPSFGSASASSASNSFGLALFSGATNPTQYVVQNLGGGRYRVSVTGVAPANPPAGFGVVKYAANDARALRVSGYQLEQASTAGNVTATTTAAISIAADAKKQVTRFAYDAAGRLVYTVGPLGQVEKNTFDGAGRVTLTTRFATAINLATLPSALPSVSQLDALAVRATAKDQQQYSVYDLGGRLSATVDALGDVIKYTRDGNGNVIEKRAYFAGVNMTTWVPGTQPGLADDPTRDQVTRSFYDAAGREALSVDALGYAVQRQYDAQGRVQRVTRYPVAVPQQTASTYAAVLGAAAAGSGAGLPPQITVYGYDSAGNRTSQTSGFGQPEAATTLYVYDGLGQLTRTIDARGVELAQSDSSWALTQRKQLNYLNAGGTALKATDLSAAQRAALAALYTTVNDYDAAGHKIAVTDALGGITRSDYDANGHVVKITDPRGNAAVYYFDAAGRVTLGVDPEGYATATTYDMFGQTLSIKRYFNKVSGTPSPAQAPALPAAHASDALTRFEYDAAGRLSRTVDAESNAERYTYNALGQRETLTNKLGGVTAYAYDQLGRVTSETLPITSKNASGQVVAVINQSAYDAFGNKTTTTEAAGLPEQRITQFKYDGLNREIERRQAQVSTYVDGRGWQTAAPSRTSAYDAAGNLIAVVDPNGGRTRAWFDANNRKIAEVSATGTLSQWTYDVAGNVLEQRVYGDTLALPVANGLPVPVNMSNVRLTTYQVDANNRVRSSTIAKVEFGEYNTQTGQYSMGTRDVVQRSIYDANGNVVRQENGRNAATLTWFDKLGQKVLEVDAMGYGVRWERDANGSVLRETRYIQNIALGSLSESTPLLDVLAKFSVGTGDQITEYSYDRNARVLSESRLNVVYGSVAANGALSEASLSATQRSVYDAMGNKSATIDAQGQRSDMRYDALGRLLSAQRPGAADFNASLVRQITDYEYDGLNNVRREIRRGTDNAVETDDQIVRYGYDATGVRTSMTTAKNETVTYGRDANGNTTAQMTDRLDADGVVARDMVSIGYDAANREMRRFTGTRDASNLPVFDVAKTVTLTYNAYGQLASKRTGSGSGSGDASGAAQEYYDYDKAGRLWRTNAQGGVNKAWLYDMAGNATLQLESQRVNLRAMTWEQMTGDGTKPNPDILITITAYDKDNRAVSVTQPKMDASRPNLVMFATVINVESGQYGGLDLSVANPLAGSTSIQAPSDTSTTGQVSILGMPFSGGNIRPITNGEAGVPGKPGNFSDTIVGVTDIVVGSAGDWTSNIENIYGAVTWRVEVGMATTFLGRVTSWPQSVHPMYSLPGYPPVSFYLHRGLAYSGLMPIRIIATSQNTGQDIVVSTGMIRPTPQATQDQTLSGTFMRLSAGEVFGSDTIQLYNRPLGSTGAFSQSLPIFKAGQGGSSLNGVAVDNWYLTRLESLGNQPTELMLVVTRADGTVVRRESIQWNPSTRQSIASVAAAQPIYTTDNVAHFTGLQTAGTSPAAIRVRIGGRETTYWPAGTAGRFDVQLNAGANDVSIDMLDARGNVMDTLVGTMNAGTSGYDMRFIGSLPSSITFRDIPLAAQTLTVEYQPLSAGGKPAGTITLTRQPGKAEWVWDARSLVADPRTLYNYALHFVARDVDGFILTDATGNITIGAVSNGTKASLTGNVKHQVLTFDPGLPTGKTLKLRYREKGATTSDFTEATATRGSINAVFKWDATANQLDPAKEYEFLYDVYNAAGAVIGNGEGYFKPDTNAANDGSNINVRWGIPNLPGEQTINNLWVVQRRQTYDAFGRVITEIDGNNSANELRYNTLGLLVDKLGPTVDVTGANGQVQTTRPTEHYSYDLNGQLVGKRDANGNQSTVQINAAGQAMAEWHPGAASGSSTVVRKAYDVFGNQRTVTDEIGRITNNSYDANNRLIRVDRPVNADGSRSFDTYEYDVLGQRVAHTNALNFRERTYYDSMGRVTRYVSAEGAIVSYGYTYDNSVASAGGIITGGWINTTTDANGRTQTLKNDVFGRTMWKQDLGGHQFTYGYNWSGLISTQTGTSGQNISYTYYDNGYLRKVIDLGVSTESTFEYDNNGNRIFEGFKSTAGDVAMVFQQSRVTYDAYNRVKKVDDARYVIDYEYDANGNRRRVKSTYKNIVDGSTEVQDYWYAYDGMNRFTVTMGQMVGGQIVRGASGDGVTIEYDNAGQRKSAIYAANGSTPSHREDYAYDGLGNLTTMSIDGVLRSRRTNDLAGRVTRYEEFYADQSLSSQKDRTWNKDNQMIREVEARLDAGTTGLKGANSATDYTLMKDGTLSSVDTITSTFDNRPAAVKAADPNQEPNGGFNITRTINNYAYVWWDSGKQTAITMGSASTAYNPQRPQPPGYSTFGYDVNGHLKTATDVNRTTPRTFSYWTNAEGQVLQRQELIGGTVAADGSVSGATKSRDHRYFYFDGKRVGNIGNDGVEREDYAQQLARTAEATSPDAKYRKFMPTNSADFDENYQPVNAGYPGPAPGSYTVRAGDTLEGIARALWGDSQLWYLLADANGLDGQPSAALTPNTVLQVPNQVTNFHNTSNTYRPYDPGRAMGDTSPTLPDPLPAPKSKSGGCGGFGQILVIVVAVVATIWTAGAASGAWGAVGTGAAGTTAGVTATGVSAGFGATMSTGLAALGGGYGAAGLAAAVAGGAVGSIASQGVGIAMGLQDSFSWKGVALGALGAGVSTGVGSWLSSGGAGAWLAGKGGDLAAAGRFAIGNVASQSLSIATGLQRSFDWRGVAASAASGYVSAWAQPMLTGSLGAVGGDLATRMAGSLMSAAVRGGSIGKALPGIIGDAVGATVGNALGDSIASANGQASEMTRGEAEERAAAREVYAMGDGIPRVNGLDFSQDAAARRAGINPAGLPTYVGSDDPAFAFDYRNGSDVASDNYNGSRRTAVVRDGQGPVAALADLGLSPAQQQAGYGYLLKTGQVQIGRNGVPTVQPGQELHIDLDDTSQAGLAGRAINRESSMRADRLAQAAQEATDNANVAETRALFNRSVTNSASSCDDMSWLSQRGTTGSSATTRISVAEAGRAQVGIENELQSLVRTQPSSSEGWAARSNALTDISSRYQNVMQSAGLKPDPMLLTTMGFQRAIADYQLNGDMAQLASSAVVTGVIVGMEGGPTLGNLGATGSMPRAGAIADSISTLGPGWRVTSPRGLGSATGPVPDGYVPVSRWVNPDEAAAWLQNGGTAIPAGVGAGERVYVTSLGAAKPGGTGPIRIDFSVPQVALTGAGKTEWYQIFQPAQSRPVYNVQIHVPDGVTIPKR